MQYVLCTLCLWKEVHREGQIQEYIFRNGHQVFLYNWKSASTKDRKWRTSWMLFYVAAISLTFMLLVIYITGNDYVGRSILWGNIVKGLRENTYFLFIIVNIWTSNTKRTYFWISSTHINQMIACTHSFTWKSTLTPTVKDFFFNK